MQPTENFSVPRRALDVEDFIDIGRRHKGWIFGPFLLTLVASVVGVYMWPDSYDSVAMVKIVPQQVSQSMVQSSITNDLSDRITSMATTVLSRNVLTNIINTHDLYKTERKRMPMDDVVENIMHPNLHIDPFIAMGAGNRTIPAFTVRFTYPDRFEANKVVTEIVNKFISENLNNRATVNTESTQFFEEQAKQAKNELDGFEKQLADFKEQNNGRLPEQVDLNYRNLTTLQTNYQNLTSAKSRAELDRLTLETSLSIEKSHKTELTREVAQPAVQPVAMKSERMLEVEREIRTLDETLTTLRQRYTESWPDVQTVKVRLEAAKQRKADLQKEEAEAKPSVAAAAPPAVNRETQRAVMDADGNVQRIESAIQQRILEIADYDKQIKDTQSRIDKLQAQIAAAPLGEQKYGDLLRERDIAKTKYMEVDAHLSKAKISNALENSGQGEHLELLDAASLPQNPTEPKRPVVIGIGAGLGLLLGVVIAAAREAKDTSLKNLKDVRAYTQMAILGSVPLLENDFVVRRRKRIAWLGWTTASLMAALTMAGSVVFYYYSKG